jgi:hypothetical protein
LAVAAAPSPRRESLQHVFTSEQAGGHRSAVQSASCFPSATDASASGGADDSGLGRELLWYDDAVDAEAAGHHGRWPTAGGTGARAREPAARSPPRTLLRTHSAAARLRVLDKLSANLDASSGSDGEGTGNGSLGDEGGGGGGGGMGAQRPRSLLQDPVAHTSGGGIGAMAAGAAAPRGSTPSSAGTARPGSRYRLGRGTSVE